MPSQVEERVDALIVCATESIAEAIARLDMAGTGALVVCHGGRKLYGLLTDGDIRRAILRATPLEEPCGSIANRNPITAPAPRQRRKLRRQPPRPRRQRLNRQSRHRPARSFSQGCDSKFCSTSSS